MRVEPQLLNAHPYEPPKGLTAKIARRLVPYQAKRVLKFRLTRPIVSFTFDDFPRSAISHGAVPLEQEGWKATFYVASALRDVTNHHGLHFAADDLPFLQSRGHEIGGHSFSHVDFSNLTPAAQISEINRNKNSLHDMGVKGVISNFAYPYGGVTVAAKRTLANQYKSLRGIRPGAHCGSADLNGLKSAPVFTGPKMAKTLDLIKSLKHKPAWLTLFAHDIRDTPSEWGCTPDEFKIVMAAVKQSGAIVLPIGQAISLVEGNHGL